MVKNIDLDVTVSPTITLYMGKMKLGVIKFENLKDTGKFLKQLRKAIKQIINEFNSKKEQ